MKNWKHLTFEQRKTISSGISHGYKLKDIGESLLVDPTSVSKEVKRNKIEISIGLKNNCKKTKRWPYVCTGCKNRYNNCPYTKYKNCQPVAGKLSWSHYCYLIYIEDDDERRFYEKECINSK